MDTIEEGMLKDCRQLGKKDELSQIYTSDWRLCCSQILHSEYDINSCRGQTEDIISSCTNLIASRPYFIFMAIFTSFCIFINLTSLFYRLVLKCDPDKSQCSSCITSLTMACLIFSLYFSILVIYDMLYDGQFVFYDRLWRSSFVCHFCGFLFTFGLLTISVSVAFYVYHSNYPFPATLPNKCSKFSPQFFSIATWSIMFLFSLGKSCCVILIPCGVNN